VNGVFVYITLISDLLIKRTQITLFRPGEVVLQTKVDIVDQFVYCALSKFTPRENAARLVAVLPETKNESRPNTPSITRPKSRCRH
jgi:hypothetical protein